MKGLNPCLTCGACCATYRVSFYWSETVPALHGYVPIELTTKVNPFFRCMKGTQYKPVRCIALDGVIGKSVKCTIYNQRSSTCKTFGVYWKNGQPFAKLEEQIRCNKARRMHRLQPFFHITPTKLHAKVCLRTRYPNSAHINQKKSFRNFSHF